MNKESTIVILLFVLALALRLVAPGASPPGFNDDELSNALVINQHVRDGDIRLYYADASGHEGLYHLLSAPLLPLFGAGHIGIRGASILLGALSVALLYLLVRRTWGGAAALIAALGLAFSFWSLVYSRVGQRHVSLPAFVLLAFYCWWRGFTSEDKRRAMPWFAGSGAALGLSFYTYFASRGVPLILIAFAVYLLLFHRALFTKHWRGMALALLIAGAFALPLVAVLNQNPDAEARVEELAAPVYALRDGDPSMLIDYTLTTLGMFAFTGDDEALYNIPHRPVFGPVGALFFFVGVAVAVWRWREPRYAFLLLWMGAGIAPGMISVPAASLGHTILAQPVSYIFPAIALGFISKRARLFNLSGAAYLFTLPPHPCAIGAFPSPTSGEGEEGKRHGWRFLPSPSMGEGLGMGEVNNHGTAKPRRVSMLFAVLALFYLGAEGIRSTIDYFIIRPRDGFTRVLFHTDFIELAHYLDAHPEIQDIVIGAQINERWNQEAFKMALDRDDLRARWYDPRAAELILPAGGYAALPHYFFEPGKLDDARYAAPLVQTGDFLIVEMPPSREDPIGDNATFTPGLTFAKLTIEDRGDTARIWTRWHVYAPLRLPERPLYAKPPAPGAPILPRLWIFLHLLPPDSDVPVFAAGNLGVDPYTLRRDILLQPFDIPLAELEPGTYRLGVGLFDVWTGERYLAEDGREVLVVGELEVPER